MGAKISQLWNSIFGNQSVRVVMVGLDAAGKTTVLYNLKLGEVVTTIPTIGFNVERIEHKNLDLQVWDIGGQDKIRPLWRHYYQNTDGVIFVVDSSDRERVGAAKEELHKTLLQDELKDAAVLIYANKQDLPRAVSTRKLVKELGLDKLQNHNWHVQGACATTGEGLVEGMDWLANTLKKTAKSR